MFNPAMAWPAAQLKANKPPASIHQFTAMTSLLRGAAHSGDVAQAEAAGHASLGRTLELDESAVDPAASLQLRQPVSMGVADDDAVLRTHHHHPRRLPVPRGGRAAPPGGARREGPPPAHRRGGGSAPAASRCSAPQ